MRHVAWKGDIALAKVIVTKGGSVEGHDGDKFTPLLGLTGAHRHHNLGILVHLVVHLDQLEFDDATDMDASRRRIGGSCHHPAPSQLHLKCLLLMRFSADMLRVCAGVEKVAWVCS
jgi:hypothetical protein